MFRDSVEIDEQKYPIRVSEIRVRADSEGAGRRRGAPVSASPTGRSTTRCAPSMSPTVATSRRAGCGVAAMARLPSPFKVTADGQEEEPPHRLRRSAGG